MKSETNSPSNISKGKAMKTTAEIITASAGILANVQIVKNNVKKIVDNFSDDDIEPNTVEDENIIESDYSDVDVTQDDAFVGDDDFTIEPTEHEDFTANDLLDS